MIDRGCCRARLFALLPVMAVGFLPAPSPLLTRRDCQAPPTSLRTLPLEGALWLTGRTSPPAATYSSSSRRASTEAEALKATARVTYEGPAEISVEDTLSIIYRPDPSFLKPDEHGGLVYLGGFNGWDGEDQPMTLPMTPLDDGSYRVTLVVPNFARSIDFIFSDSVRYDTNHDQYYHLRVTNVQEAGPDGNVYTYRQEEDGSLTSTGMIAKVDPQELEKMVDDALESAKKSVNEGLEVMLTSQEQLQVQKLRSEASMVGERLGLGSMLVNEARDTFDMFDDDATMTLEAGALGKALGHMGFELGEEEMKALMDKHVRSQRPGAESLTLMEFMMIFAELDNADTGLDMV